MDNWKIVLTLTYPHEAHIVQGYLESLGIETMIQDELTVQVHNFYSNAIGGVKLLVRQEDFAKGRQALEEGGYLTTIPKPAVEVEEVDPREVSSKKICPFCKSKNISKNTPPNVITIILSLISEIWLPSIRAKYTCHDCSKKWRYTR